MAAEADTGFEALTCLDHEAIQERVFAEAAGLGWIGKNTCIIDQKLGSWLFLGVILTSLELEPGLPAPDRCGSCTRCLDACPTDAIREPFVVDANRCIAFHTIENRAEALPAAIAGALQGWVAGCDICQEVCPWNRAPLPASADPDLQPRPWWLDLRPEQALSWSDADWDEKLRASALRRIKPAMWRRNIQAALQGGSAAPSLPTLH